jgi:hypothetical protein
MFQRHLTQMTTGRFNVNQGVDQTSLFLVNVLSSIILISSFALIIWIATVM